MGKLSFQEIQYGGWTFCIVLRICTLECVVSLSWFQATISCSVIPALKWNQIRRSLVYQITSRHVYHIRDQKRMYWISQWLCMLMHGNVSAIYETLFPAQIVLSILQEGDNLRNLILVFLRSDLILQHKWDVKQTYHTHTHLHDVASSHCIYSN